MRASLILFIACAAHAQIHGDDTSGYEAASIKLSKSGDHASGPRTGAGGRLNVTNTTLKDLISFAWDVRSYQISGGPPWLGSAGWDIVATPEHPVNPGVANIDHFRLMLRSLLVERFKLAVHTETRELPVYALLTGKDGPKLKPDDPATDPRAQRLHLSNGRLTSNGIPLPFLARVLSEYLGRPVVDRTGLTGAYDFNLEWTPDVTESKLPLDAGQAPPDPAGPALFTAIQEQLGLRLESQKGPVGVLIVDHAEKAPEN